MAFLRAKHDKYWWTTSISSAVAVASSAVFVFFDMVNQARSTKEYEIVSLVALAVTLLAAIVASVAYDRSTGENKISLIDVGVVVALAIAACVVVMKIFVL